MIKAKDTKILEEMKEKIKALPLEERVTAVAVYRLTEDYFKSLAVEEAEEEKIDEEYQKVEHVVLQKNNEIISGERAATEEELKELPTFLMEGENCDPSTHNKAQAINEYWLTVFKNCQMYMDDCDLEALKSLKSISIKEDKISEEEKKNSATFVFDSNDFFTNTELTLTATTKDEMVVASEGTPIDWKEGKNMTIKKISKTQKNKKTGKKRTVEKEVKVKSFFGLFTKFSEEDMENEDAYDDEEEQPNLYIVNDILEQLGDVVPFSLEYYLGVIENDDDDDGADDFEDDDDDDDDDDDEPKSRFK